MNASELVAQAIKNHGVFKNTVLELKKLEPDREAAVRLVEAYRSGTAEPWMTACLLGCNGHEAGYETVREILISNAGLMSESYAGVSLAEIRGMAACDDILSIMFEAENPKVRRGAACGLAKLNPPKAVEQFLNAYDHGLLPRNDVAAHIAKCGPEDDLLVRLLDQSDSHQRLAIGIIWRLTNKGAEARPPGREVAEAVLQVLNTGTDKTRPSDRGPLREWAEETAGQH